MLQRCDVELIGDKEINRSHFMIKFDVLSKQFMLRDVGYTNNIAGGTFIKVNKNYPIRQGMIFVTGS
jgi:hypothetical protein